MRSNQEVQNKLNLLRERFVERTGTELEVLVERLFVEQLSDVLIRDLHQCLHRLAGSAGTFGLSRLGAGAKELEIQVQQVLQGTVQDNGRAPADVLSQALGADFPEDLRRLHDELTASQPEAGIAAPEEVPGEEFSQSSTQYVIFIGTSQELWEGLASNLTSYGFSLVRLHEPQKASVWLERGNRGEQVALLVEDRFAQELTRMRESVRPFPASTIPIIALSHEDSFASRYKMAEIGCNGFFPLPLDIPAVADRVERLLAEEREARTGRVLLIDDDRNLSEHFKTILEVAGLIVKTINSPQEVGSILSELRPDIVLMDWYLGNYSGVTLARMIRFQPEWLGIPIIYLSSEQDKQNQLNAMASGGDEFMTKPISDADLVRAVQIRCFRARQLSKLLYCDSLTGLLQHAFIKQEVAKEHARQARRGGQSVVVMLDLDHFKSVNDQYGHAIGDVVIKSVANVLRHRLRNTDAIGRYGGEEFAVVLSECSLQQAEVLFQEICQHFSSIPFMAGDRTFQVTVSVGLADLSTFEDGEKALAAADEALYQRKLQGRNGVTVYQQTNG